MKKKNWKSLGAMALIAAAVSSAPTMAFAQEVKMVKIIPASITQEMDAAETVEAIKIDIQEQDSQENMKLIQLHKTTQKLKKIQQIKATKLNLAKSGKEAKQISAIPAITIEQMAMRVIDQNK